MSAGVFDQLSQLSQSTPSKTTTVRSPDASQTDETTQSSQSPSLEEKPAKQRPTAPHSQLQPRTRPSTSKLTPARDDSRDISSETPRGKTPDLPTRLEIQEFSFRLRDEIKVKVQAEVPYKWQDELEEVARALDVKKLELYRFIIGEFLGKVKRKP